MEKVDFVSTGRSLYVRFVSKTGSYSGSALYYWAHYDFFNNTKFGDPVQNTMCDEIFYAWKYTSGKLRSPLNTLIYKRTSGSDIRCQYKFVTDKRLYARVVIEVTSVTFKEIPYSVTSCTRCHEERVDKLIIWEEKEKNQNRLACFCDNIPRPVRVISSGDQMNLEMIIQGQHATSSYFKNTNTLFQANYEFAHGPICGPITIGPSADGELIFPNRNALGYQYNNNNDNNNNKEKCIWELKVAAQRDLWLHLEKVHFTERSCDNGRIEVYLAGRLEPRFIICPENVSLAKDLPILSAAELGALDNENNEPLPVLIQYTGDNVPGKNAFRLVWTELFHLPRNPDGTLVAQMLQSDCDFHCPQDHSVCIPKYLLCNGIQNCPNNKTINHNNNININSHNNNQNDYVHNIDSIIEIIERNLYKLGILNDNNKLDINDDNIHKYLNDESPEICDLINKYNNDNVDDDVIVNNSNDITFVKLLLIVVGLIVLFLLLLTILCKMCRRND